MKSRVCGSCRHWRQLSLGRDDGTCEAPLPAWVWLRGEANRICPKRTELRSSADAQECDVFAVPERTTRIRLEVGT